MYKKAIVCLLVIQTLFWVSYGCMLITNPKVENRKKMVYEVKLNRLVLADRESSVMEISMSTSSEPRLVTYKVMDRPQKETIQLLSKEDYENLLRIVEAEASGEDETGKLLVANVVLNRVADESFPDTITEVIFQKNNGVTQFSPVSNGRFWSVTVSDETVQAVERALSGEDVSQGALYFAARKYANENSMRWFDEKLNYLFTYGGHEFFKE